MFPNALPSEQAAVVATIDPDAYAANTYTSDFVDMSKFEALMAVLMLGDLGAEAEITFKLTESTDSSGTGEQDITGKSVTTLTHSPVDSDKQAIINLRAEELDLDDGYRYVRMSLTVANATSDCGAIALGFNPRELPASDNDLSSVDEIVT